MLNLSHNELNRISVHITYLKKLRALILNNNHIKVVENVDGLLNLTTLGTSIPLLCFANCALTNLIAANF